MKLFTCFKIPHLVAFLSSLIVRFLGVFTISSSFLSKSSCCLISSSILGFYLNLTVFNKLFSNEDAKICPASISIVESPMQMMLVISCHKKKNYVRVLGRVEFLKRWNFPLVNWVRKLTSVLGPRWYYWDLFLCDKLISFGHKFLATVLHPTLSRISNDRQVTFSHAWDQYFWYIRVTSGKHFIILFPELWELEVVEVCCA